MQQRTLGRTGRPVSVVGLGTWQLGADWGDVAEDEALTVLDAAVESGVTFFHTADVYGDGRSEQQPGVTSVIPGARSAGQARANAAAADAPPLSQSTLDVVRELYDRRIRPQVHDRW